MTPYPWKLLTKTPIQINILNPQPTKVSATYEATQDFTIDKGDQITIEWEIEPLSQRES